jgi:hypothetical protein
MINDVLGVGQGGNDGAKDGGREESNDKEQADGVHFESVRLESMSDCNLIAAGRTL